MKGWGKLKLGEVFKLEYGKPLPAERRADDGEFPAYGANGVKCRTNDIYWEKPSIVVGRKGSAGEINLVDGGFWPLDVTYFVVFDENKYDLRFLYYMLSRLNLPALANGVKPGLNRNHVYEIEQRFPPLPEQERIVAILDEAFAAIATATVNAEKNLNHGRDLFISRLHQVFGVPKSDYAKATVSELARHSLGKMLDKQKNRGKLRPYLRNFNVRWFDFDLDDLLEMRFQDSERDKYTAEAGDLLMCEGGYPGRAAVWPGPEPMHFQKAIHRLRFHDARHTNWFLYFLYYINATGEIRQYFTGTGIQHFTGKSLATVSVPIPSSVEIAKHVAGFQAAQAEADDLARIYIKKLALLNELQQSILHKAFGGELTADPKVSDRTLSEAGV